PDMPHAKYVMSSLTTKDGCTTLAHRSQAVTVRYRYGEGYYNRTEKDFYGYDTVRTIYADESYEVTHYANRAYYSKGVAVRNEVHSGTGSDIVLRDTVHRLCEEPVALINRTETTTREAGCSG
ncbi:toxin TcdB middle/N-terminal domain-containing protein, partial [Treponema socranskii]